MLNLFCATVQFGGASVSKQYFSPIEHLSQTFGIEDDDGVLGLAYPSLSSLHQSPFIQSAKTEGAIKSAEFGFKLTGDGSELYIGGTDSAQYDGALEYHPVVGHGFWQLGSATLTIGSTVCAPLLPQC